MSVRTARLDGSPTVPRHADRRLDAGSRASGRRRPLRDRADGRWPRRSASRCRSRPVPFTLQPMVVLLGGAALGRASRDGESGALSRTRHRGLSGLCRIAGAAPGHLPAARPDRRIPHELSVRGVRRRRPRRARLRSPLPDVGARDGRGSRRDLRRAASLWLAWFARPAHAGLDAALRTGLYPFLPADIVKICIAAAVMPGVWALLGRRR